MAEVRISSHDVEKGEVPPVCIRCGRPAAVWKRLKFEFTNASVSPEPGPGSVNADWFYLIWFIFGVIGLLLDWMKNKPQPRPLILSIPFCSVHRFHWFGWKILPPMLVVGSLLLFCGLAVYDHHSGNLGPSAGKIMCGILGLVIVSFFLSILGQEYAVRITSVEGNRVTLAGVSEVFVKELGEYRRGKKKRHEPGESPEGEAPGS